MAYDELSRYYQRKQGEHGWARAVLLSQGKHEHDYLAQRPFTYLTLSQLSKAWRIIILPRPASPLFPEPCGLFGFKN